MIVFSASDERESPITGDTTIEELGGEISVRCWNVLNDLAITVGQVAQFEEHALLLQPNCGRKTINEIKEVLFAAGLTLRNLKPSRPRDRRPKAPKETHASPHAAYQRLTVRLWQLVKKGDETTRDIAFEYLKYLIRRLEDRYDPHP